jgi:hypothetical protein
VATGTVKRHINNIYAKLDVHSPALRDGEGEGAEGVRGLIFDLKHNLHSSHFLIYLNVWILPFPLRVCHPAHLGAMVSHQKKQYGKDNNF